MTDASRSFLVTSPSWPQCWIDTVSCKFLAEKLLVRMCDVHSRLYVCKRRGLNSEVITSIHHECHFYPINPLHLRNCDQRTNSPAHSLQWRKRSQTVSSGIVVVSFGLSRDRGVCRRVWCHSNFLRLFSVASCTFLSQSKSRCSC